MLVTPVSPDQWRALGEGAGYRAIEPLRKHLVRPESASPSSGAERSIRPDIPGAPAKAVTTGASSLPAGHAGPATGVISLVPSSDFPPLRLSMKIDQMQIAVEPAATPEN